MYAVLRNLEDLPSCDPEVADMIRDWNICIAFIVRGGPRGYLRFRDGAIEFGEGNAPSPDVKLFFVSPSHFNAMMDNKGTPIPLKGFTRLKFLTKDLPKVTDKLEYYLKPDAGKTRNSDYVRINTAFTLNTAVFAVRELALNDPVGRLNAEHIMDGDVLFEILPDGPRAFLTFGGGGVTASKGSPQKPMALMRFRDIQAAYDLLNNVSDPFTAVACGEVMLKGRIVMIDAINQILDRIPAYLS
jgi:hypothetical protein